MRHPPLGDAAGADAAGATAAGADATGADATVTLRFASFDDAPDLFRLAQLDSAEPLSEPILVADVSGRLAAALSLSEDRVIADPFVLSGGAVELLRARGRQLSGTGRPWGRRRVRRLRRVRTLRRAGAL
ncbi:MAG TPA: hypothetical protein VHW96_14630 [Solirubrobacteraceae bacterium]|jgi:hypothetical protein|nr:hypothetical protein [Solirubrobacteraceae bacterium]